MLKSSINGITSLDRGSVHFITTPTCITEEPHPDGVTTLSFRILDAQDNCVTCGGTPNGTITYAGFLGDEAAVNDATTSLCLSNSVTSLRVAANNTAFLKLTGSPPVMTGCVDIRDFNLVDNRGENYIFNVQGNKKQNPTATINPCGREFKSGSITEYELNGSVAIGNNTPTSLNANSLIQYGTIDIGIDAGKQGIIANLFFNDSDGKTQAIKWIYVLDTVPLCPPSTVTPSSLAARRFQLDFTASADNSNARLEWVNNTGDKNDYFIVQKSGENGVFQDLEFMNGKFKSATKYFWTYDYKTAEGENFYRLKVVLYNGAYKYSDVKTIEFDAIKDVRLSPNPADDNLHIDLKNYNDTPVSVFMYNAFGQTVLNKINTSNHVNAIDLDTSSLQTGQYVVRITAKNKRDVLKKIMIVK